MNEKQFLEEQLEWTKEQIILLDKIEEKLQEMKRLAIYARDHQENREQIKRIQEQIFRIQQEINMLQHEFKQCTH